MVGMELLMELDLGDLRLRTLITRDAALLVEATQAESAPALWGPAPVARWRARPRRCSRAASWRAVHGAASSWTRRARCAWEMPHRA
jgi:hypothetical protein